MLQLGNLDNYTHKMPILLKEWGEDAVMIQTIRASNIFKLPTHISKNRPTKFHMSRLFQDNQHLRVHVEHRVIC